MLINANYFLLMKTKEFFFHYVGYPITTEDIRYGLRVSVLVLPADFRLLTEKALPVVGPQGFQINDVRYHKPKPLSDWINHCNDLIDLFLLCDFRDWPNVEY